MFRLSVWMLAAIFVCGLFGVSWAGQGGDIPRFEDYPAQIYTGPVAAPDDPDLNRDEREEIAATLSQEVGFGGEYVIHFQPCGSSGCVYNGLYSKRTGKFLAGFMSWCGVQDERMMRVGEEIREHRADSNLLITGGVPEGEESKGFDHVNYYVLQDGELKLIRSVLVRLGQAWREEAPKFAAYPSQVYRGPAAALDVPEFSAVEQESAAARLSEPVQYAGDYVVYERGCGTGCSTQVLLNKRTGRMVHGFTATWGLAENYDLPMGEEILEIRPDSGLLVTGGVSEDIVEFRPDGEGPPYHVKAGMQAMFSTKYYILQYGDLKLLRVVKTPF